ncbi:MAG: hypothetical protein CM1200mP26_17750 [Acidimicrobiales bacterium]|nr:MAG: hypothetical protein CM1200mP26_17750 [Acidimicrobiales bacterium]
MPPLKSGETTAHSNIGSPVLTWKPLEHLPTSSALVGKIATRTSRTVWTTNTSHRSFQNRQQRFPHPVTKGQSQNSAGRNGKRDWGIHLFSSSYPLGFAEVLPGGSFADDQVTAFHEYFHAVQHAHIYTFNNDKRQNEFQVQERANWFGEGGAEWMAQITTQRLRESGVLTPSDANPLAERMAYKMRTMLEWKEENPGLKLSEIPPHGMNNVGYDYGTWAHAYLANLVGPDALLEEFYPNLNQLGHDGAFLHTYNMTMEDFIKEFDSFVSLPIEEQLQILPFGDRRPRYINHHRAAHHNHYRPVGNRDHHPSGSPLRI